MELSMKLPTSLLCVVLFLTSFLVSGCGKDSNPLAPSLGIPFSSTDTLVGSGTVAVAGKTIRVYYTGWLYSTTATDNKGTQFDANTSGLGFQFVLGNGSVIKGWDQGVVGMKVGGKRRLIIPPELAYGTAGSGGVIPGNATLIFEIELLAVAG
jgi:FKBP-type peptidyl-prolyl cis-trans isomerase FkpA